MPALEQLEAAFLDAQDDPAFAAELNGLLANYAGRPTPLTRCRNLPGNIYLKREDLLHGGAHKTNQVLGQGLLAKRMGKTRLIAETGAGQHGVATAIVGALLGFETVIYMGAEDVERQELNVFRMQLMGAEVVPVESGGRTLKDAINEALRDWSASFETTHYLLGTAAGPHPFPTMVREFQRVIGREARAQIIEQLGRLPDAVVACVGGGSNAIGLFADFLDDDVRLIGVEAAGQGPRWRRAWRDLAARHARHPSRRRNLRAAGRRRADRRQLVGLRRARLSRGRAGACASQGQRPRRICRRDRRRGARGVQGAGREAKASCARSNPRTRSRMR